jgi:hypothetical protein
VDTNRTVLASTSVAVRTTRDAVVVGAMDVVVVQGCGFGEDRENGEKSEG